MPAVTRVGDDDTPHCSAMTRYEGSPNVFANGKPISRKGDKNTEHLKYSDKDECVNHTGKITKGSSSVFINGEQCGRVGDPTCTEVAEGSRNVFAGD